MLQHSRTRATLQVAVRTVLLVHGWLFIISIKQLPEFEGTGTVGVRPESLKRKEIFNCLHVFLI